jgi:hypothetical protein
LNSCFLPSDLSCFKFVTGVTLSSNKADKFDFTGIFHNLNRLSIFHCRGLASITINSTVKNIKITYADSLYTLFGIGKVESLDIVHCPSLTRIDGLVKANFVNLSYLTNLSDFAF